MALGSTVGITTMVAGGVAGGVIGGVAGGVIGVSVGVTVGGNEGGGELTPREEMVIALFPEVPPSSRGLYTVILWGPITLIKEVGRRAVRRVEELKVVVREVPSNFTEAPEAKFTPVMVSVVASAFWKTSLGETLETVGRYWPNLAMKAS